MDGDVSDVLERLTRGLAPRYRLEGQIGAGGMATVYLAEDLRHGRKVAIKVLRPELAEALGPDRFTREIEIAARLTHPHILGLHDSGELDGLLYYVMPFVEGPSLRDRLETRGPLPVAEAARIFREIVDALGAAHERHVVHRDVKPGNVLLLGDHALVTDFGVARALREAAGGREATTLGVTLGTPAYMSPEQASADPGVDHRSDLFSAAVVAYEMLTGRRPFAAATPQATLAALLTREAEHPSRLRPEVPEALGDLILECLEKDPGTRPRNAAEVLRRLDAIPIDPAGVGSSRRGRDEVRPFWSRGRIAAAVFGLGVATVGVWRVVERRGEVDWARQEALPEVLRLADEGRPREAAELAFEVEEVLGADPVLEPIWPRVTSPIRIVTDPPGATVAYRAYTSPDTSWRTLGTTPLERDRFPAGAFRFRVESAGHRPLEVARSFVSAEALAFFRETGVDYLNDPTYAIELRLTPDDDTTDMIPVSGGTVFTIPVVGFESIDPVEVPFFEIDRTEVTNAAYLEFVEAGAYADSTRWTEPFVRDGAPVPWAEAIASLVDETGRPGPSTWVLGRPAEGRDTDPVSGVSWYEAMAYCSWRGKSLPTLFHWARATLPSAEAWVPFHPILAGASNLGSDGPEPVGVRDAIGISGAQDLAGNVREWVTTRAGEDRHFAGGAWNDPEYAVADQVIASPWVRLPSDGFRCVRYPEGAPPEALRRSVGRPAQDLSNFTPMTDEVFRASQGLYTYDHAQPLAARVDSTWATPSGETVEWVSVDAAYGGRLPIRIHVPADAEPPFGAVLFFPGSNLLSSRTMGPPVLSFLPRAGWLLVEPVYDGGFSRNDGTTRQRRQSPAGQAELFAHWAQDLGRTIDYLEQRPDVDSDAIAYAGLSLGAGVASRLLPYEPRIGAAILLSGGMPSNQPQEALDRIGAIAGRARTPLLMLGGRNDFSNPASHQEALFRAWGVPDDQKTIHLYEAAHWPLPLSEVIRETVDFLERTLRPRDGVR